MIEYKVLKSQVIKMGGYSILPVQRSHIESIRVWRNEQMQVLRQSHHIEKQEQEAYFTQKIWSQTESDEPSELLLSFFLNDLHIGYGGLVHISWGNRRAEVSFLSATTRANDASLYPDDFIAFLKIIKIMAAQQLNLNKLSSETYEFRQSHIKLLESVGFVKEGVLRQHTFLQGKPIDSILHGCFL